MTHSTSLTTLHIATSDLSEALCGWRASEAPMGAAHIATCQQCLALQRCRAGTATTADRILLAHRGVTPATSAVMFGPLEWRAGNKALGIPSHHVRATWGWTMDTVESGDMRFERFACAMIQGRTLHI